MTGSVKPCYVCRKPAPTTFNATQVFEAWAAANEIISPDRSRFDNVKRLLKWAAKDETSEGAHPACALRDALTKEGYSTRYSIIPGDLTLPK